jgi:hypothetical protein
MSTMRRWRKRMHNTVANLKDGRTVAGPIWRWRGREGWLTLLVDGEEVRVDLADCDTVITRGARVGDGRLVDRDEMDRATQEGWNGGESDCSKCRGTGSYMYDHNHGKPCERCCLHDQGWWELTEHYAGYVEGENNNCCKAGCGALQRDLQSEETL